MPQNTQVLIASVPNGPLSPEHFTMHVGEAPECADGHVMCRTLALTGVVWGETTVTASEVKPNFSDAPVNWFQFWTAGHKKARIDRRRQFDAMMEQRRPPAPRQNRPRKQEACEIEYLRHVVGRADATERVRQHLSRMVPVQSFRSAYAQVSSR
jgi:hypothetical protein